MIAAILILLALTVAVVIGCVAVFNKKELVDKQELKDFKHEYAILEGALRDSFVNPDDAQLYISTAFNEISLLKQKKEIQ